VNWSSATVSGKPNSAASPSPTASVRIHENHIWIRGAVPLWIGVPALSARLHRARRRRHGSDDLLRLVVETKATAAKTRRTRADDGDVLGAAVNNLRRSGAGRSPNSPTSTRSKRTSPRKSRRINRMLEQAARETRRWADVSKRAAAATKSVRNRRTRRRRQRRDVETLRHTADKRVNIPTAEHQSVLEPRHLARRELRYPRNTDLDPQLVWRGKDYQDWSDLASRRRALHYGEGASKALLDRFCCANSKSGEVG